MSLMAPMVKPMHDGIDDTEGIFLTLLCQVEVDHGGFQVGVSEVFLDDPDIDACFEEMGCVGMSQRMYGYSFLGDSGLELGPSESALYGVDGHRGSRCRPKIVSSSQGREDKLRIAMGSPVLPHESHGVIG